MKKRVIIAVAAVLLLSGCRDENSASSGETNPAPSETVSSDQENESRASSDAGNAQISTDSDSTDTESESERNPAGSEPDISPFSDDDNQNNEASEHTGSNYLERDNE